MEGRLDRAVDVSVVRRRCNQSGRHRTAGKSGIWMVGLAQNQCHFQALPIQYHFRSVAGPSVAGPSVAGPSENLGVAPQPRT